jgi:hypothetical protein
MWNAILIPRRRHRFPGKNLQARIRFLRLGKEWCGVASSQKTEDPGNCSQPLYRIFRSTSPGIQRMTARNVLIFPIATSYRSCSHASLNAAATS